MYLHIKYRYLIILLILFCCSCSLINPNISSVYKVKTRDKGSNGITLKSTNKLILYKDLSYREIYKSSDGECGQIIEEQGNYKITGDTLALKPELEILNSQTKYLIKNNRLYHLNYNNIDDWTMKKNVL
jgi:hypothetical protein